MAHRRDAAPPRTWTQQEEGEALAAMTTPAAKFADGKATMKQAAGRADETATAKQLMLHHKTIQGARRVGEEWASGSKHMEACKGQRWSGC